MNKLFNYFSKNFLVLSSKCNDSESQGIQGLYSKLASLPCCFFVVLCVTFMGVTRELFLLPCQRKRKQQRAKAGETGRRGNGARTMAVTFKLLITQLPKWHSKFLIKPNCLRIAGRTEGQVVQ